MAYTKKFCEISFAGSWSAKNLADSIRQNILQIFAKFRNILFLGTYFFLALAVRPVFFKADQLSRFEKISKFAYVYSNYTVWALANYSCVTKTYVRTRAQLL
jgi:hypothetical protein